MTDALNIANITLESLNIGSLIPMLITISGALLILCIDLMTKKTLDKSLYTMLTVLILIIDLMFVVGYGGAMRGFFDLILMDGIAILSQIVIIISSILFILFAVSKKKFHEYKYPEYFALLLFSIAGFQFMVSSDSLILIFVAIETSAMSLYAMIAMHNRRNAIEAAIKYFTMGALAAGFFSFGAMIMYAATGSVELPVIAQVITDASFGSYGLVLVGLLFIFAAMAFKLSLLPFHTWLPDVYEGSSSAMAGFLAIVPKIAALVVTFRILEIFLNTNDVWTTTVLYIVVVVTMTVPNMIALVQKDVKRMLAYSSISHAGFVMAAILVNSSQSLEAMFLYWILFLFTALGAFGMLWANREKNNSDFESDHAFTKFSGLVKKHPLIASLMAIFMLSLAGIPPFALFWGKIYLLGSVINEGFIVLALIMALNSAIAGYYYLKLIVVMFFKEPLDDTKISYFDNASFVVKISLFVAAVGTVFAVFWLDDLSALITNYISISGF